MGSRVSLGTRRDESSDFETASYSYSSEMMVRLSELGMCYKKKAGGVFLRNFSNLWDQLSVLVNVA